MVLAAEIRGKTRGRIQVGADDPSLTAAGGMLAVTELCGKLGLTEALDAGMGPVKQRRRGFTGGQVLAGMAAAQLAGEDFLVGVRHEVAHVRVNSQIGGPTRVRSAA